MNVTSYLLLVLWWSIHGAVLPRCLYVFIVYMFPVPFPFLLLFRQLYSIYATFNFMCKSHTEASDSISSLYCCTATVSGHVRYTSKGMNVRLGGERVQVWFQAGTWHFSLLQNTHYVLNIIMRGRFSFSSEALKSSASTDNSNTPHGVECWGCWQLLRQSKNYLLFMKLRYWHESTTGLLLESDKSIAHFVTLRLQNPFEYYPYT
jgi:hypothetical protein